MTKQELLDDLLAKSWVLLLNGTAKLVQTIDVTNVYEQSIFEGALDTGTFRNIYFYVYKEGEVDETAVYKDRIPQSKIANDDEVFASEIEGYFKANYPQQHFTVIAPNAELEACFIRTIIGDPSPSDDDKVLVLYEVIRTLGVYTVHLVKVSDEIIANL